jgi:hypothetical protein
VRGGKSFGCVSSGGQATGSTIFQALPQGNDHLALAADKPGAQGGIAIQLSGKLSP